MTVRRAKMTHAASINGEEPYLVFHSIADGHQANKLDFCKATFRVAVSMTFVQSV